MGARGAIIALTLSVLLTGGAVAADGSAGPTVVVEGGDDPEARAAVTFPAGWRLEAAGDASRRQINALAIDERCEVDTRRSAFPDLLTDVDDFVVSLGPGSGYILLDRQSLELPAGAAERVDFADNEDGGRWSVYVVADDGWMHELWCRGDVLPDDRWFPIAETITLDPEPGLTSTAFDPVVTRPDTGLRMAFDGAWQVRGSSTNQGLLYATSETAVCSVSDYTELAGDRGWDSVDAMHDEYVAIADGRDNLNVDDATYLDLPGGRAGFADISFDDGTRAIRYSFGSPDGTLLALFCVGDPTPGDRYLALAESVTWEPPAAE